MPRRKRSAWLNSTVLGIGLASFFSDLSHETVTSLLPGLLATLGVAAAALGTIEGVADGLSSVAKLYGGWWTDRLHRRKPLCAAGYGIMAAATLVIAVAWHWTVVLTGRTLSWVARGLRTPPRKALLAEAVTPEYFGRAFGLERMMDTLGAVLAPLATLLLLRAGFAQRDLLLWATMPALLAVLAITFLVRETPARDPHPRPLLASYRELPLPYLRLLRWIGLFGTGDFAHSLMILYATSALSARLGVGQAASAARGALRSPQRLLRGEHLPGRLPGRSLCPRFYGIPRPFACRFEVGDLASLCPLDQLRMGCTTCPWTSVRRRRMPL
jgi:MFS family permease